MPFDPVVLRSQLVELFDGLPACPEAARVFRALRTWARTARQETRGEALPPGDKSAGMILDRAEALLGPTWRETLDPYLRGDAGSAPLDAVMETAADLIGEE